MSAAKRLGSPVLDANEAPLTNKSETAEDTPTPISERPGQVAPQPAVEGWHAPFVGIAHTLLACSLQEMFTTAIEDSSGRQCMTHASIIQSSGSGKSRLVDEVARIIFTIPFNLREARDVASGAWPPADDEIRDVLVQWAAEDGETRLRARFLCFFAAVFDETRKEVEQSMPQPASVNTPSAWHIHLAEKESEHRNALYARVVNSDAMRDAMAMPSDVQSARVNTLLKTAKDALKQLLCAICTRTACHASHADAAGSRTITDIHVLVYFDEAHILANQLESPGSSLSEPGKTALDVLFPLLDDFRELGLFAVFMSTQPYIEHLESNSSTHHVRLPPHAHAPITETPFDCFGDRPVDPSHLRVEDLCDVAFMACFGRPMWRSMLLPFSDEALARASGKPLEKNPSPTPDRDADERHERCESLLRFAQAQLVSQSESDLERGRKEFCQAAQTAVLDVRILLPFEPRSSVAHRLQLELVASHMRTLYTVPQHRGRVRSGYSSEPILAEAAARQLHLWRTVASEDRFWGRRFPASEPEPALLILRDCVECGLLDPDDEEILKAVGRLLLTLARDRASVAAFPGPDTDTDTDMLPRRRLPPFSRAVPVNAFVEALFPPAVARLVLSSTPNNLPPDSPEGRPATFGDAFQDAVVDFTHFVRWDPEGESVPDEHVALRCFVRSMAMVCHRKNDAGVDVFVPVLLDKSKAARLCPRAPAGAGVMTALLVRFARAQGLRTACPIDERVAGLFDRDGQTTTTGAAAAARRRPYIALVMALGASGVPAGVPTPPVVVGRPLHVKDEDEDETAPHPRYSITAYGCSREVYQVVGEDESSVYQGILRRGDPDPLRVHPRQDARSLDLVRRLRPEFSNASWSWSAQPEPLSEEDSDSDED